jgi:hypothetical protein
MRKEILAAAAILVSAAPAYAQQATNPSPSNSGGSIIRQPSGSGASSGTSGSIGSSGPTYPAPLRDYNNPAASYPRLGTGTGTYRR